VSVFSRTVDVRDALAGVPEESRLKRSLLLVGAAALVVGGFSNHVSTQTPGKVDFAKDVQPIFRQSCIGCHGPSQQMAGFRLDRRRDAMRGGTIAVIGPGNSDGSRLYRRLIGSEFGAQMPPTGALSPDKVAIIKTWIDQGAEWPDALAGDQPAAPPDVDASRLVAAIKRGDRAGFAATLKANPTASQKRDAGGVTPLMAAALNGDASQMQQLLDAGADPNATNDSGVTALMWAVTDSRKTELLLAHGAKVDIKSLDGRTALMIAAGFRGSRRSAELLLDAHADPNVVSTDGTTALSQAAYVDDPVLFERLVQNGASLAKAGAGAVYLAALYGCDKCADLLLRPGELPKELLNVAATIVAPPGGDGAAVKFLIEHGADSQTKDPAGRTLLMLAAASDLQSADAVQLLLAQGVDVNATGPKGETALMYARQHGATPIVDLLLKSGARDSAPASAPVPQAAPAASIRQALERSVPLLQRNDVSSMKKAGCVSCHNNTLTAVTVSNVRQSGFGVDEQAARSQVQAIAAYSESWRERILQGMGIPGDVDTISYILVGLAAEHHPADDATAAMARFIKGHQLPDGHWAIFAHRPPLESSDIEVTALSMRALQLYMPSRDAAEYKTAINDAARWLARATPKSTEDRAFQLLGLVWAGTARDTVKARSRELIAEQRPDGGWAQIPTLTSDAYATGQALVALQQSGVSARTDAALKRGIQFLLSSQLEDGSWLVKTRAIRIQPHYESGFPHGMDQFISAAGTNWAATALAMAARP
jgi:ankyrin repeat protein